MKRVREQRNDLLARVPRLQVLFAFGLIVIGTAYWRVQVVQGEYYRGLADNNRLRQEPIKARRGLIHDRNGRLLVDNLPSYNLMLDRSHGDDVPGALEFAAGILERSSEELAQVVAGAPGPLFEPVLIAEDLSLAEVSKVRVAALEHPEFTIEVDHLRLYRYGPTTAHVLGYLGEANASDLAIESAHYRAGDLVGRKGVERVFDLELRGRDGVRELIVDSRGRPRDEQGRRSAEAGKDFALTLDIELQQEAARYLEGRAGSAVALNPSTGEVLVLVSAPSYNPNLFTRRLESSQWQEILEAEHNPLQNRVIQNAYPPGSVFKMVMGIAGLNEGVVTPEDSVYCGGSTVIYNRRTRCWLRRGHGRVDLRKAIKESCDIYFYALGQEVGINRIAHYARLFGLGRATGFDIPGERSGLIPDTQWSLSRRGSPWYPGETVSVAVGQGPILVTPMQVAGMVAALANGGRLVTPHVRHGAGKPLSRPIDIDPSTIDRVRDAMWAVVNEKDGTGVSVRLPGIDVAGKTGTAQVIEQETWIKNEDLPEDQRDHAWFASYAPAENPEIVVVAFVEHGGHGSDAAAPLVRLIYERYFRTADAG